MRENRVFLASLLVMLGVVLSGCGMAFGGSSGGKTTNWSSVSLNPQNITSTSNQNDNTTSNLTGNEPANQASVGNAGPYYPSFGLDTTGPEVVALNERLAQLGFLPVDISGNNQPIISLANLNTPPQVQFAWRYSNIPVALAAQWAPNVYTQMTRGAVIAVERQNGLAVDGMVGLQVWKDILGNSAKPDAYPYSYVQVTKDSVPERLQVWQAGTIVFSGPSNTGIKQAPTTDGTYPIYLRFLSQTMTGKNPDGTKYSDAGIPFINYFNGSDAVHGFNRSQYGFPQSVGCVELPVSAARTVWSLVHYGTLVTVSGHYVVAPKVTSSPGTTAPGANTTGFSNTTVGNNTVASNNTTVASNKTGVSNTIVGNNTTTSSNRTVAGNDTTGISNNTAVVNNTTGN